MQMRNTVDEFGYHQLILGPTLAKSRVVALPVTWVLRPTLLVTAFTKIGTRHLGNTSFRKPSVNTSRLVTTNPLGGSDYFWIADDSVPAPRTPDLVTYSRGYAGLMF
jgi:hypothetical protein